MLTQAINEFDIVPAGASLSAPSGLGFSKIPLFPLSPLLFLAESYWKRISLSRFHENLSRGYKFERYDLLSDSISAGTVLDVMQKIENLDEEYKLIQPQTRYVLKVSQLDVHGNSSVVKKLNVKTAFLVHFYESNKEVDPETDIVSLIRWLQLKMSGALECDLGVLHVQLNGTSVSKSFHKVNEAFETISNRMRKIDRLWTK